MAYTTLYSEDDKPVTDFEVDVPAWIEQDITPSTVAAILEGGCASGSYMPAVTYHTANETMAKHGDDVLQYIEDHDGELPQIQGDTSWSGIAVLFLSCAVESWAHSIEDELTRAIREARADDAE